MLGKAILLVALVALPAHAAPTWTSNLATTMQLSTAETKVHTSVLTSANCNTNFGPVPGFYESGNRKYVAIASTQHASQASNTDLLAAAACLSAATSCDFTAGTYGLRLTGNAQSPSYQNNEQANACLNSLTGTTNFYQRTTNSYTYIFATSDSAMTGLNTAAASAASTTDPTIAPTITPSVPPTRTPTTRTPTAQPTTPTHAPVRDGSYWSEVQTKDEVYVINNVEHRVDWTVGLEKGSYCQNATDNVTCIDLGFNGSETFNHKFYYSSHKIIQRRCSSCSSDYQTIFYRRWTELDRKSVV